MTMKKIIAHIRKFIKYYVLGTFVAMNVFIAGQALLSSSESAEVSGAFSNFISAFFHAIGPTEADIIEPETLTVSGPDIVIIGQSKRLTPTILPLDTTDKSVFWTSDNDDVLEVTTGGIVVAKDIGQATIRATSAKATVFADMTIEVLDYPNIATFVISTANTDIYVGTTTTIDVSQVTPELARLDSIVWSSDNGTIATVNEYGVVKGVNAGSTTIRATAGTYVETLDINVAVSPTPVVAPTALTLSGDTTGFIYRYHQLTADFGAVTPTDASITWVSSDRNIARVDENGLVYGYKFEGTATITAISNVDDALRATQDMTFEKVYPTAVSLNVDKTDIIVGYSTNIHFDFEPGDTYDRQLVWTSSDETVAHISSRGEYGLFTAIKVGTVTVTASSVMDETITASIVMTVLKASTLSPEQTEAMQAFVRKGLGHFFLFFADGLLGYLLMYYFLKDRKHWKYFLVSLAIGLVLAPSMEALQLFAPGRTPLASDAVINYLGYLTANVIIFVAFLIYLKRKEKRQPIAESVK